MKPQQKLSNSYSGFAAVVLIIGLVIVAVAGAALLVISRSHNQDNQGDSAPTKTDAPIVIHNFGVDSLDSINVTTDATRDFTASGHKGMYIFGDILPGTPVRHNPNFEFASVKEGTKIIAAMDGVIGYIKQQPESNDNEVYLMTSEQSDWIIGYDHLTDLKVQKGDKVSVGQTLGSPARQNNGLLRFEFQINKNKNGHDDLHICPSTLLAAAVKDKWLKELKDVLDNWEAVSGMELYDTAKQDPIGCYMSQMTAAYAQGLGQ